MKTFGHLQLSAPYEEYTYAPIHVIRLIANVFMTMKSNVLKKVRSVF